MPAQLKSLHKSTKFLHSTFITLIAFLMTFMNIKSDMIDLNITQALSMLQAK